MSYCANLAADPVKRCFPPGHWARGFHMVVQVLLEACRVLC